MVESDDDDDDDAPEEEENGRDVEDDTADKQDKAPHLHIIIMVTMVMIQDREAGIQ